jgi:mannonate dehydratase
VDQYVENAAGALEVCQRRAAHVVSIKASKMGTLDECRRVADICAAFGVRIHVGGSVATTAVDAAQAQWVASMPEVEEEAEVGEYMAVSGDPISGPVIRDGRLEPGSEPGLGLSLAPVGAQS